MGGRGRDGDRGRDPRDPPGARGLRDHVEVGTQPRGRALILNVAERSGGIAGAVLTLLAGSSESAQRILVPFSAGAFLYIANADLLPELHKEFETSKSLLQLVALVGGIP